MRNSKPVINVLWAVDHLGFNERIHGAGMFYLNAIPALDKNKFNVSMCVLRRKDSLHKYVVERGIDNIHYFERSKYNPFTIVDFISILKREKIDIMHLHGYGANNFGRFARIFFKVPTIIHSHDPSTYYPWFQKVADIMLLKFCDITLAVSDSIKYATAQKRGMPLDNISVIPTCTPLEGFKPLTREEILSIRKKLEIASDCKILGTVTRFYEQKGNEFLIKAMPRVLSKFPKTILILVGDGPLKTELEALSQELGISENVIFAGHCEDVRSMLGIFDIKVLPSLWEGTPITMLEAMAMGKTIVATSCDGIGEVLKDRETALLVPPGDADALAEKILYLLEHEDEAKMLGSKASEVSKEYDVSAIAAKLEDIYDRLYESVRSKGIQGRVSS